MRRGAQELAPEALEAPGRFELIVATDMLDLPAFLALTRSRFAATPALLFMHENQFTYPRVKGTKFNSWFGQINYLSTLVADRVSFNSNYHKADFLGALRQLTTEPNNWLVNERIQAIENKSTVLPLGVELSGLDTFRDRVGKDAGEPPLVLWNHRWEFDKAPDMFVRTLVRLASEEIPFRIAVAGEPGPNPHPALRDLPEHFGSRVIHHGFARDREEYGKLLWKSKVVVSTTRHEFFGVGMIEALYCEAWPVAPNSFTYPELVPPELQSHCLFESESDFYRLLKKVLTDGAPTGDHLLRLAVERFDWKHAVGAWDDAIDSVLRGGAHTRP